MYKKIWKNNMENSFRVDGNPAIFLLHNIFKTNLIEILTIVYSLYRDLQPKCIFHGKIYHKLYMFFYTFMYIKCVKQNHLLTQ